MNALSQISLLPDGLLQILENMYNLFDHLNFVSLDELSRLTGSPIYQRYTVARKDKDQIAMSEISVAFQAELYQGVDSYWPFNISAAMDLAFRPDEIVEFYQSLAANSGVFDRWRDDDFMYTSSPWTKLQFVLAADHYKTDADTLGLVVGHAWKEGQHQSIMTANFDFATCSRLLEASSERGLNAVDPAPRKPIAKTLYRGGSFCPKLPHGMSWSEDRDEAVFFANRQSKGTPIIVNTQSEDNKVLVRYVHEAEVVLPYDPTRAFKIEFL